MPVRATVGLFCTLFKTVIKYIKHYLYFGCFSLQVMGLVKVPVKDMVKGQV